MSESHMGIKLSDKTKNKISKSSKGNKSKLGKKDSEKTKYKKSESGKQKVKCQNNNKIYSSVKECIECLKISRRKFYKMVSEKIIIYI